MSSNNQMPATPYGKPNFEEMRADNLHPDTAIGAEGPTVGVVASRALSVPAGTYFIDRSGAVLQADTVGTLPADVTLNGSVYMAGSTALPAGLSVDPATGMILTDGTTYYPNTINNVGVLCAAAE